MVFDAHDRAFAFFGGACTRGIHDNMRTAVDAVFTGKQRTYNRRFVQMCSHYLVDPPSIHAQLRDRQVDAAGAFGGETRHWRLS